jgi:hypothetical protein
MGTIFFICFIIVVIICLIIVYNTQNILPARNEEVFILLKNFKKEIIENKNIYTLDEINNAINIMVNLYITNKCDFIEEYRDKYLLIYAYNLQITNIQLYKKLKRRKIINDIKYQLELIRKNELNEYMMFEINSQKILLSSDEFKQFISEQITNLQSSMKQYKSYIDDYFILVDERNNLDEEVSTIMNIV